MKAIWQITKKELKVYFNSPIAYIFITIFLGISSWIFFRNFFLIGQISMQGFFGFLPWLFLFLIPAITMRLWAEEKKIGTIEVLLTWPIKDYQAVVGKFLASLIFLIISLGLSLSIPITISTIGSLDWGIVIAGYLGAIFLGAAYLAIGLWITSLTENQIIAFILAVAVCFLIFIVGESFVTSTLPSFLGEIAQYLGIGHHFNSIGRGVIDSRDIIYYISVIGFFLYLNTRQIESRKWK